MFTKACEFAAAFTRPVVLSRRAVGGACSAGTGAFVVGKGSGRLPGGRIRLDE